MQLQASANELAIIRLYIFLFRSLNWPIVVAALY